MREARPEPEIMSPRAETCPGCEGHGWIGGRRCGACDGVGSRVAQQRADEQPVDLAAVEPEQWIPKINAWVLVKRGKNLGMTGKVVFIQGDSMHGNSTDADIHVIGYGRKAWVRASDLEPSQPLSPENAAVATHVAHDRRASLTDAQPWVPRVGDRVRVVRGPQVGTTGPVFGYRAPANSPDTSVSIRAADGYVLAMISDCEPLPPEPAPYIADVRHYTQQEHEARAEAMLATADRAAPTTGPAQSLRAHATAMRAEADSLVLRAEVVDRIAAALDGYAGGDGAELLREAAEIVEGAA